MPKLYGNPTTMILATEEQKQTNQHQQVSCSTYGLRDKRDCEPIIAVLDVNAADSRLTSSL